MNSSGTGMNSWHRHKQLMKAARQLSQAACNGRVLKEPLDGEGRAR